MSSSVFIDTNIFVYFFEDKDPRKQRLAQSTIERLVDANLATISYQIVQEFANVALRKFSLSLKPDHVQMFLDDILWPICQVYPSPRLLSEAISIQSETGWSFYDSLIVSAAAQARCGVLLTEDLQAGRKIRGVEIQNPFA